MVFKEINKEPFSSEAGYVRCCAIITLSLASHRGQSITEQLYPKSSPAPASSPYQSPCELANPLSLSLAHSFGLQPPPPGYTFTRGGEKEPEALYSFQTDRKLYMISG